MLYMEFHIVKENDMSEIPTKDSTGAFPNRQQPQPADADKNPMYTNRQQRENVGDWKRGIQGVQGVK